MSLMLCLASAVLIAVTDSEIYLSTIEVSLPNASFIKTILLVLVEASTTLLLTFANDLDLID